MAVMLKAGYSYSVKIGKRVDHVMTTSLIAPGRRDL